MRIQLQNIYKNETGKLITIVGIWDDQFMGSDGNIYTPGGTPMFECSSKLIELVTIGDPVTVRV